MVTHSQSGSDIELINSNPDFTSFEDLSSTIAIEGAVSIPIVATRPITQTSRGIYKANPRYVLLTAACEIPIMKSPWVALLDPRWKRLWNKRLHALLERHLDFNSRESTDIVINLQWIFKVKKNLDGLMERFKVQKRTSTSDDVDYHETFSPVVKVVSVHLVLMIVVT